jgi:hypothetical protein
MHPSWGRKHRASDLSGLLRPPARMSGSMSTKLVRLAAVLGCILVAAAPGAWAGPSLILGGSGTVLTLNGLTFTVTTCTVKLGSATVHNCASSDNLELLGVSTGRGTVTLDVIGTGGGPIFSLASSANQTDTLTLGLSAATNAPATAKVSSATLTLNATGPSSGGWGTNSASWTQTVSLHPSPLALALTGASTATTASSNWSPTTSGSSFTITDTIALTRTGCSGCTISLSSAVEKFNTAPEPASIGVLLLGLGGLAMARRRRGSRADAA